MTTEELIHARLSSWAPLTDIVGDRISAMRALDASNYPCVTYMVLGSHVEYTHDGPEAWREPLVQIDAWASDNYDTCIAIAREILAALYEADDPGNDEYFFIEMDGRDKEDPSRQLFRRMIEVRVWKRP